MLSRRKTDFRLEDNEVAMYDIFNTLNKGEDSTVLVEGSPGIGKTTFCLKIAYDWANGKIPKGCSFPEFNIVLLLKCRDIDGDVIKAIDQQLLPEDDDVKKELRDYIQDIHNQEQVLIILDGLDELPRDAEHHVNRLLHRRMFPFCFLLATSRQETGIELRQNVNFAVLLQIEGFTDKDAFEYIRKHFTLLGPEHLSKGERLIKAIKENSFLRALPSNPLNLLLLCVVFEDYEGELPSGRTELYQIIVRCILRRFCAKNKLEAPQDDVALEKKFEESLLALGELAWKCLLEDCHSFNERELTKFENMHKELVARTLGLVFKEASVKKINPQHEYHFFHKTFQEYLAAAYLAFLLLKKEVNIFKEFQLDFHDHIVVKYRQVFLFLSGILGGEASILFRQIGEKLKSKAWDWLECSEEEATFFTESFSESGDAEEVAVALCSFIPFPLTVHLDQELACDFFKVAKYCQNFSKLQHPVHLTVSYEGKVEDSVLRGVSYTNPLPSYSKLHNFFEIVFSDVLSQNSTLLSVSIRTLQSLSCDVADIVGDSLAASTTLTSVTFELFNEWGEAWAEALEKGLSADTPLNSVVLKIHGSLNHTPIQALKRVLVNTSLTSVVITIFGEMQDSLAAALCEGLSEQTVLKSFTLVVFGRLSESGMLFLERGFSQNCSLDALEVKIFGELPDRWATVVNGIISANKAKESCVFHPNISGNIAAAKVACLCPGLANSSFNLELALNVWGKLSCELIEALGKLLVKSKLCRLTTNIHGKVTDDVASSLTCYLKYAHFVTVNIWGELTTNGKAAIERFSSSNDNPNVNLIVHDLISDSSPDGLHFCIDNPSLLPSVFTKVKETGSSELSLAISGASDRWAKFVEYGLTNSTSLTIFTLAIKNRHGEDVGCIQRLLEVVLRNTSLASLNLAFSGHSDMRIQSGGNLAEVSSERFLTTHQGINLGISLAKNTSLSALSLAIDIHSGNNVAGLRGLTSNVSLHPLTLTINSYSGMVVVLMIGLSHGLASNESLRTLTLTINDHSITDHWLPRPLSPFPSLPLFPFFPGTADHFDDHFSDDHFSDDHFSDEVEVCTQCLGCGLGFNKSLQTLTLTINNYRDLGKDWFKGLGRGLRSNKSLHTLTLTINSYSDAGGDWMEHLCRDLASNFSFHTLTLTINKYSATGEVRMEHMGCGLVSNFSLPTLTLTINNYSATGEVWMEHLCRGLASNFSLRTLTLTINNYSATGEVWMEHLGRGLASNVSLRTLTLTVSNFIEKDKVSDSLTRNKSLTTISHTVNNYSNTAGDRMKYLGDGFARNKSLTTVSLTINNYINTAGDWIRYLGDGFARNESLTTVSFTINSCSEVSEDQLLAIIWQKLTH